jgi:hypothetical protein
MSVADQTRRAPSILMKKWSETIRQNQAVGLTVRAPAALFLDRRDHGGKG